MVYVEEYDIAGSRGVFELAYELGLVFYDWPEKHTAWCGDRGCVWIVVFEDRLKTRGTGDVGAALDEYRRVLEDLRAARARVAGLRDAEEYAARWRAARERMLESLRLVAIAVAGHDPLEREDCERLAAALRGLAPCDCGEA